MKELCSSSMQYLFAVLVTVCAVCSHEDVPVVTVETDTIITPTEEVTWIPFSKVGTLPFIRSIMQMSPAMRPTEPLLRSA